MRGRMFGRAMTIGVLLLGCMFLGVGCSTPEERYQVLSFFFDGVPVPESMREQLANTEQAKGGTTGQTQVTDEAAQEVTWVYHAPYADGVSCQACHDLQQGMEMRSGNEAELCRDCHSSHFTYEAGDWMHGPAALGECRMCHEPHKSEHPDLLTSAQPEICLNCHDGEALLDRPHHVTAKAGQDRCGKCHDPHLAGNRKLLVDSRTYRNRRVRAFRPQSVHAPYQDRSQCRHCHIAEEGNRVRDDVDAACRDCHADLIEAAQAPDSGVHAPIAEGQCISCHNPHESPRPNLLRTTAEQMCVDCHAPEALAEADHPASVVRADCLICHKGHSSERPNLLRTFEVDEREQSQPQPPKDQAPAGSAASETAHGGAL